MNIKQPWADAPTVYQVTLTPAEAGDLVHSVTMALRNDGRPGRNIAWTGSNRDGVSGALQFVIEDTPPKPQGYGLDSMESELVEPEHADAIMRIKNDLRYLHDRGYPPEQIVHKLIDHPQVDRAYTGDEADEYGVVMGGMYYQLAVSTDVSVQHADEA